MKHITFLLIILLTLSCSNKDKEAAYEQKIASLEQQLDDCQNGADKLYARMKLSYEEESLSECNRIYQEMVKRHPESELFDEVKGLYNKLKEKKEKEKKEKDLALEKEKEEKLKALNKLKKTYDDIEDITWYKNPYYTHYNNINSTSIYFGSGASSTWLRLKMSYTGDSWIFFEEAYLSYDGNTKKIVFDKYKDKTTDNSGGGVWEWIDVSINEDIRVFLKDFVKSPNAKMRLTGKYTKTKTLTANERNGILAVLNGYEALKESKM